MDTWSDDCSGCTCRITGPEMQCDHDQRGGSGCPFDRPMTKWPVDGDFVMRSEDIPTAMKEGMGEAARDRAILRKAHGLKDD